MPPKHTLHLGDSAEVLKQYPDNYFHAIVCDPPYGIKARSTKTGATDGKYPKPQPHELEQYEPYYSQKLSYSFVELHDKLL